MPPPDGERSPRSVGERCQVVVPMLSRCARCPRAPQAINDFNVEKDMAAFIKREFDRKYRCAGRAPPSAALAAPLGV